MDLVYTQLEILCFCRSVYSFIFIFIICVAVLISAVIFHAFQFCLPSFVFFNAFLAVPFFSLSMWTVNSSAVFPLGVLKVRLLLTK